jgi:hypothetical protein
MFSGHVAKVMFEKKRLGQVILESCKQKKSPARVAPREASSSMAQLRQANNAAAATDVVGSSLPITRGVGMTHRCGNWSCL